MNNDKLEKLAQKERERQQQFQHRVFCCTSTACLSAGADVTLDALDRAVSSQNGSGSTELVNTGCMGLCSRGPLVRVETKGKKKILYGDVTADIAKQIIARHITGVDAAGRHDGRRQSGRGLGIR